MKNKNKKETRYEQFKNSKQLLAIIILAIGISGTVCYYEGSDLYSDYQEAMSIWEDYNTRHGLISAEEVKAYSEASEQVSRDGSEEIQSPPPIKEMSVEDKIRKEFGDEAENAIRVCACESQMHPDKIGDKHMAKWSYGLFQINRTWHDYSPETLLNADENIKIAKQIYDRGGWKRWTCAKIVGVI